jgi:GNAT superfamily N-acetyltransferase
MLTTRTLMPADHRQFQNLYAAAPPADRVTRFCACIGDEQVARYTVGAIANAADLVGVFDGDTLLGAAEVFVTQGHAEMAFLVAHEVQGQGIGGQLMAAALSVAHERGACTACVMAAPTNVAMHRLALSQGLVRTFGHEDWSAEMALDTETDSHLPSVYQTAMLL